MIGEYSKLDESFSTARERPESKDELAAMQRRYPGDLPGTHVWDYRWEPPTAEELSKNRYLLPTLVYGPRELTLAEIAAKTKDFSTLGHGELRWLVDRHAVKMLPLDPKNPRPNEVEALRQAIRAHAEAHPADTKPKRAVPASKPASQTEAIVLPTDVAAMDRKAIETAAAPLGLHDEWKRIANKPIEFQRAWLAQARASKKPELASA